MNLENLAHLLHSNTGYTLPLPLRVIGVSGTDAQEFLQGQLTLDLKRLPADGHKPAAWCNAKGRVWAQLQVWSMDQGYALLVPENQAEAFLKRLRMFVLRAQVTLEALPLSVQGVIGAGPEQGLRLSDDATTLLWHDAHHALRIALAPEAPTIATEDWIALRILAGEAQIDAGTQEKFLPQALGLEQRDGLHFNKGCYVGQEVVARVHYKGRSPQRLACYLNPEQDQLVEAQVLSRVELQEQQLVQVVEYC